MVKILNPLTINDWNIKTFFVVILAIQLIMWGSIGLDAVHFTIPILRPLIGFFYLGFVPGILILRILQLHKLNNIETLMYTIGLSHVSLLFIGFFVNFVYPLLGISKPITTFSLIITISIFIIVLCIICYFRDHNYSNLKFLYLKNLISTTSLFLILIPFLSIFGVYLVNFNNSNVLLMLMIALIFAFILLIGYNKIPCNLYPLVIWVTSISLLLHRSLISMYITGSDIHTEYYFYNLVKLNGVWNYNLQNNFNSVLSCTIFPAIYSNILNIDGEWVFKVIYPTFFSFLPLGLFHIYEMQTNGKIAVISTFYFVSIFSYYTELPSLIKQQIAEFFYMLLILVMLNKDKNLFKSKILFIIFSFGLVVSHYGTTYLFIFLSFLAFFVMKYLLNYKSKLFTKGQIILLFISAIGWYIYIARSSPFISVTNIITKILLNLYLDFFSSQGTQAIAIMTQEIPLLCQFFRLLYYISQILIFFGMLGLLKSVILDKKIRLTNEYIAYSISSFIVLIICVIVPHFTVMNIYRIYHILMFFLSPFLAFGYSYLFQIINHYLKRPIIHMKYAISMKHVSIFLAIFFIFNSGFIFELTKNPPGYPSSISLGKNSIEKFGDRSDITSYYTKYSQEDDIFGIKWITKYKNNELKIYTDSIHKDRTFRSYGMNFDVLLLTNTTKMDGKSYLYLGYLNTKYLLMSSWRSTEDYWSLNDILTKINHKSKVYSNGNCVILWN